MNITNPTKTCRKRWASSGASDCKLCCLNNCCENTAPTIRRGCTLKLSTLVIDFDMLV